MPYILDLKIYKDDHQMEHGNFVWILRGETLKKVSWKHLRTCRVLVTHFVRGGDKS